MINGGDPRTEPHQFATPPPWIAFPTKVAPPLFMVRRNLAYRQDNDYSVSDMLRLGSAILGCEVFGNWNLNGSISSVSSTKN